MDDVVFDTVEAPGFVDDYESRDTEFAEFSSLEFMDSECFQDAGLADEDGDDLFGLDLDDMEIEESETVALSG